MKKLSLLTLLIGGWILFPTLGYSNNQHKIDSMLTVLKYAKEDTNKAKTLYALSVAYLRNEPEKSLDYAQQTLALAERLKFTRYVFNAYQSLAGYYYYKSNTPVAGEYFSKALALAEKMNDKNALGKVYSNLSLLATKNFDYHQAIDYSERAMKIASELKDSSVIGTLTNNRALIYINISDYPSAINYLLQSLRIHKLLNEPQKTATNYYYLGYCFMLSNNDEKALSYFQLSISAAKESNDQFQLAQTLDKMGEVYLARKDWTRALDYFQQAITIGREVGSFVNIISSTQNIAMVYNGQGKYDEAIQSATNALELASQVQDKMGMGNSYAYIAEVYIKKKDYKTAIEYYTKSLETAKEIGAKGNEAHALKGLSICHEQLANYKTSLEFLKQYQTVNDSIISNESIRHTAEAEAKYQLDKNEKEIALLTKDKEIQALEIKKQTTLKNSFIVGLVLVCVLAFFAYRYYSSQQKLKLQTLRNKIASDLHDDVGSTLSSIAIFSEIARQESKEVIPLLDQIGESSRKMLESMADIVWTINPENDNFEKIVLRMRSFAFELLGPRKIDFEFNADDSVFDMNLSMDARKNLYLIFKEAINNMVKYSGANRASFSISSSNNNLTMLIRDNGSGFDTGRLTMGNGIKNMKSRASEIGAQFLIESEPGKGTTIQLLMKAA